MPTWRYRVHLEDVFRNEGMTFEERRDEIVRRLRTSGWFKSRGDGGTLHCLVDDLAHAEDADYFDYVWDQVYDEADADRAWITTF